MVETTADNRAPASPSAAVRLGMIGLAYANRDGVVTRVDGKLSQWLEVGQRVAESSSALLGMDEALEELRAHPGQRLTLPNICLDQAEQRTFHTINVQWDELSSQYVISTTRVENSSGDEMDALREFRAQRYLQERIEEQRQHFRTLYEQSPHLSACFNNKGQLLAASNDLRRRFLDGEARENSLLRQLSRGPIWDAMWAGERLQAHPLKATDNAGELCQLELSGYLVTPPNTLTQEVYYSLTEVTERNRYRLQMQERRDELEAAAEHLREANERLSRFASIAAHDLLSPLRRIATFTQILGEEVDRPQSDSLQFALRAIQHSAERGQTLVDDVLHMAQLGSRAARLEWLDPSALLRLVARDSDLALAQCQGQIEFVGDEQQVLGDPKLLRTIYRNLLSNAIKYRDPERPLRIEHKISDTGTGHARIEFTDNGMGFDPERAAQVFEPFTRLVGDDEVAGSGLGLAIVKEASKAMGYRVSASSLPGAGTTIALMAPNA